MTMEDSISYCPFKIAEAHLRKLKVSPGGKPAVTKVKSDKLSPQDDEALFRAAMADVVPLAANHRSYSNPPPKHIRYAGHMKDKQETLRALRLLIDQGKGFTVADTPEYMEGTGHNVSREWARRLHRGDFPIQDHLDLHGCTIPAAKSALDAFLSAAVTSGKTAVLIIHGRGLSSPGEPVLKNKVGEWLARSAWRKWIMAFTSARTCDGGAGATYVLFHPNPPTLRFRRHTPV